MTSFHLSPVKCSEIEILLSNLNSNKASLEVPNRLLKIASQPLSIPLAHIYNESIATQVYFLIL